MRKAIIEAIKKDSRIIKKNNFENLFRLMMDYQLSAMFGKKGFRLKEHIDFILDLIISSNSRDYLDYIRENMLASEEPENYLKAVQLILNNVERYFWFWLEDHFPKDLMKDLLALNDIFIAFRDKLVFGQFKNKLKLDKEEKSKSDNIIEEDRFFLHKKTREIKDYFETILESTSDGVISTDVNGKIVLFNRGAASLFGYSQEEIFHKGASLLYADEDDAEALKQALIASGGHVHSFETTMRNKNGETFPALISASLLRKKNGKSEGIVRYVKNIAQLKEMAQKLRELSEFKTRHLHNISHEIKTPISTILGFVDIISNYYQQTLDVNVQRYMEKITSTSRVLIDMLDTLLDLSRIEKGKLELEKTDFDLKEIIEDLKVIFLPLLSEKGIDFSTEIKLENTTVHADKSRIRQIIFNLVSNALKYTPESGKVSLKITPVENGWQIEVSDTGKGIKTEDLDSIFDEFHQLEDNAGVGSGLGLPLARHLARLHGGDVTVESKPGIGSKFKVIIKS